MANPIVTFTMENGDVMKAELYPEIAPNTVNNFISLVKKGSHLHQLIISLILFRRDSMTDLYFTE